jgi:beta-glucosidase
MVKFPKDFFWGAATSAYQVEGNNRNSDWWPWEKKAGKERSGRAARHYDLYKQDFDLAKRLHHNAHRLSIEWSRVEPKEGKFSRKEIAHYIDVILALRKRGIEPVVTLHHFTNPIWFSARGGWTNSRSVMQFLRFSEYTVRALAKHVQHWITINEPMVYITHAFILGVWPPQEKSYLKAAQVEENLAIAHIKAYQAIHKIYKESKLAKPSVGVAQNVMAFVPCKHDLKNQFAAYVRDKVYNTGFLDRIMMEKSMDFIGVNYYSRQLVELRKWGITNLVTDVCQKNHHPVKKNSLGWDIYPEGLYQILLELKKYNLPIMITENGICTADDKLRWEYLSAHLKNIHRAIRKGVRVTGYLYWALIDNFEWDKGFAPRFGLVDINYKTFKRTVRKSAKKFAEVCKTGILK